MAKSEFEDSEMDVNGEPTAVLVGARGNADCGEPYRVQYEALPGGTR